jgi:hypothetical protein
MVCAAGYQGSSRENRRVPFLGAIQRVGLRCVGNVSDGQKRCDITWGYVAWMGGGMGGGVNSRRVAGSGRLRLRLPRNSTKTGENASVDCWKV